MRNRLTLLLTLTAACGGSEGRSSSNTAAADSVTPGSTSVSATATPGAPATPTTTAAGSAPASPGAAGQPAPPTAGRPQAGAASRPNPPSSIVRALYVNRWAAQSSTKMRRLIEIADATEINAMVIDTKDEFGLNYRPSNPEHQRMAGTASGIRDLRSLLDTLKAHDILPIARIVVFKDSVAARVHPEWTIQKPDGTPWRDKKGLTWVNPYSREIWEYNIGLAEELVKLGFGEIQWDYIRFPEPYKSLPTQVFPGRGDVSKPALLAEFLTLAKQRLGALGVRSTADIFGLVTTVNGPLEIGQHWEPLAPVTDVLLPMVYPSHYPRGAFGVERPNADPYKIVYAAISKARERNDKLGIQGEHVRPYLQAFSMGNPPYGAVELEAQKKAVYDSGFDGWVLWSPGSQYEPYLAAFEKETVSRKKGGA